MQARNLGRGGGGGGWGVGGGGVVKVRLDTILTIYMCGARIIDAN